MKQKDLHIQTKEVREGLRRLLGELDNADLSGLAARVRMEGSTKTAAAWVEALRTAERELAEWCPNLKEGSLQFTIDVPPKAR